MSYYTSAQLAQSAGIAGRTFRDHLHNGYIRPEQKIPGTRGHRFSERTARTWISRYYPGKKLVGTEVVL